MTDLIRRIVGVTSACVALAFVAPAPAQAEDDWFWARPCSDRPIADCIDPTQGYMILHDYNTRGQISTRGPGHCRLEHDPDTMPAAVTCKEYSRFDKVPDNAVFYFTPFDLDTEPAEVRNHIKLYRTDWKKQAGIKGYYRVTSGFGKSLEAATGKTTALRTRNEGAPKPHGSYLQLTDDLLGNKAAANAGGIFFMARVKGDGRPNAVRFVNGLFCDIGDNPCDPDAPLTREAHLVTHWSGNRVYGHDFSDQFFPDESYTFRIVKVRGMRLPERVNTPKSLTDGSLQSTPVRLVWKFDFSRCFPDAFDKTLDCSAPGKDGRIGPKIGRKTITEWEHENMTLTLAPEAGDLGLDLVPAGSGSTQQFFLFKGDDGSLRLQTSSFQDLGLDLTANADGSVSLTRSKSDGGGLICRNGPRSLGTCPKADTFLIVK